MGPRFEEKTHPLPRTVLTTRNATFLVQEKNIGLVSQAKAAAGAGR
jgi:hypothetical protein